MRGPGGIDTDPGRRRGSAGDGRDDALYRVHAVPGGEEAVAYLETCPVDLMVLDMIMDPGMDGLETYKRAIEINPKRKAFIVSGFSETDRVREAQRLEAGPYVKKPYVLEKIALAVRDELDR